jgi:hypothetical protein
MESRNFIAASYATEAFVYLAHANRLNIDALASQSDPVPRLVLSLRSKNLETAGYSASVLAKFVLKRPETLNDLSIQKNVISSLVVLLGAQNDQAAGYAALALIQLLKKHPTSVAVLASQEDAIPRLVTLLRSDNQVSVAYVKKLLILLLPKHPSLAATFITQSLPLQTTVPLLKFHGDAAEILAILMHDDPSCAQAIGRQPHVIPCLVTLLDSPRHQLIQQQAGLALANLILLYPPTIDQVAGNPNLVPCLIKLLEWKDENFISDAVQILQNFVTEKKSDVLNPLNQADAMRGLVLLLQSKNEQLVHNALKTLLKLMDFPEARNEVLNPANVASLLQIIINYPQNDEIINSAEMMLTQLVYFCDLCATELARQPNTIPDLEKLTNSDGSRGQ